MKLLISVVMLNLIGIGLIGCTNATKEYRDFVQKYGAETRTYCDGEFKMRETFLSKQAQKPQVYLINSQDCTKTKKFK